MGFKTPLRTSELTTTAGLGAIVLGGAETGCQGFAAKLADGDTVRFCIEAISPGGNPTGQWEVSEGAYTAAAGTLARTTLIDSSTGAAVNFAAGSKRVYAVERVGASILRDGTQPPTGPQDWNNQDLTGVKNLTAKKATFSGAAFTPAVAPAVAANTAIDCSLGNVFRLAMTLNITTLTITNPGDGQTINLVCKQDATGNRTLAMPASFTWPGGTPGVLSTAAGAKDIIVALYDASDGKWICSIAKQHS